MRRIETWIISRSHHDDSAIAEMLDAYVRAGVTKTPSPWNRQLQIDAGREAGFGGSNNNKAITSRSRAAELTKLGWLEMAGKAKNKTIRLTQLGEQILNSLTRSPTVFQRLVRLSRLNLKCVAQSSGLKGITIFPSLTVLYVLKRIGGPDAYITEDDLRYFLLWSWDDPRSADGKNELNKIAQAISEAHTAGVYPAVHFPDYDIDAPRHFVANFIRTGLFRQEGEKVLLNHSGIPTALSGNVTDWDGAWDAVRKNVSGTHGTPVPKVKSSPIKFTFDPNEQAADLAEPPKRVSSTVTRIVRNTAMVKQLKELYGHRCQVCNTYLYLSEDTFYAEGHHLKPLGKSHNGPDIVSNVLILCPNHHAMFDLGVIAISPTDGRTLLHVDPNAKERGQKLNVQHRIGDGYIAYHHEHIWRGQR